MIPLFHDFSDETVVIFGGGTVGARKAERFATAASVVVVSPSFADRTTALAVDSSSVSLVRAAPTPQTVDGWLDRTGPALVVAATDDRTLNAAVEAAARERGVLVNRTDVSGEREFGSAVVPATVADGKVRVAISTGGRSPALSKYLREQVGSEIEDAGAMAELTGEIREELQATGADPESRRAAVRAVVRDRGVWKALHEGDSKARVKADRIVDQFVDI